MTVQKMKQKRASYGEIIVCIFPSVLALPRISGTFVIISAVCNW
jgi:hypothetical protein